MRKKTVRLISAKLSFIIITLLSVVYSLSARAQIGPIITGGNAPGVYIEPDGTVKRRQVEERDELSAMRNRINSTRDALKSEKLAFVSLPNAFAEAKAAIDGNKPIPDSVRYLGGITQIKYIFVYPDKNDLLIGGPSEAVQVLDDTNAVGKKTGRPVMRLEDFVVAMRVVKDARQHSFGCRLDPDPAAPGRIRDAMDKLAGAARSQRLKAVQEATGPQKVSFNGGVPDDTRFAFTMIAADYELKRYGLGLAKTTVPDLGNIVDNSRAAVNMIWFELGYDPILVSQQGDAFAFRGARLKIQAGSFDWDPKGATPKAFEFAKRMTKNMDTLSTSQPLLADLQNLADLSVLAALIQKDRLDSKVKWDTSWIMNRKDGYPVPKVTVPRTADALVNYTNGSIAAGGVVLTPGKVLEAPMEKDDKNLIESARTSLSRLRSDKPSQAVLSPQ